MENKELRKNLNKLSKEGFWLKCKDISQIYPLIENGAVGVFSKDGKWYWVWLKKGIASKQRIKEFITVLNIKIKQDERSTRIS
jgi:hypothetical protein